MHSVWLALVVPVMFFLIWGFAQMRLRQIWLISLALASVIIVGFVGLDLQQHFASGGASNGIFQRVVFRIVSATDFPLFAVWIGSLINVVCCGWMRGSSTDQSPDQTSNTADPETFTLAG